MYGHKIYDVLDPRSMMYRLADRSNPTNVPVLCSAPFCNFRRVWPSDLWCLGFLIMARLQVILFFVKHRCARPHLHTSICHATIYFKHLLDYLTCYWWGPCIVASLVLWVTLMDLVCCVDLGRLLCLKLACWVWMVALLVVWTNILLWALEYFSKMMLVTSWYGGRIMIALVCILFISLEHRVIMGISV